jgi:hypothetical protein
MAAVPRGPLTRAPRPGDSCLEDGFTVWGPARPTMDLNWAPLDGLPMPSRRLFGCGCAALGGPGTIPSGRSWASQASLFGPDPGFRDPGSRSQRPASRTGSWEASERPKRPSERAQNQLSGRPKGPRKGWLRGVGQEKAPPRGAVSSRLAASTGPEKARAAKIGSSKVVCRGENALPDGRHIRERSESSM